MKKEIQLEMVKFKLMLFLVFVAISASTVFSQTAEEPKWSEWFLLREDISGRAKVAEETSSSVGLQWELKIDKERFARVPHLSSETFYVRVYQYYKPEKTGGKGTFSSEKPLRIKFEPNAHDKSYLIPDLFWFPKTDKDKYMEMTWKKEDIFPKATYYSNGRTGLWWGASMMVESVLNNNLIRFDPEKSYINEYKSVN